MSLLLGIVAFAWLMGINLYILLYQQRNVALASYLRTYYPDIYEKSKNRLFWSLLATDKQTRNMLTSAMGNAKLEDPLIEEVLNELSILRQRGVWTFVPLTSLLLLLALLYFRG